MFNDELIKKTSILLNLKEEQIKIVLNLLEEGATIPFIARYRKHLTGYLNEDQIREIADIYEYQIKLQKRKETIIKSLKEKDLLTDELELMINNCSKLVELEAIYKPYKDGKKTKASEAIKLGLEPLANWMLELNKKPELYEYAQQFVNPPNVTDVHHAVELASYIIAQKVSNDIEIRDTLKETVFNFGIINSKLKKDATDENDNFAIYYDFNSKVSKIKPYQVMAIDRGEDKKILSISFDYKIDFALKKAYFKYSRNFDSENAVMIRKAIDDAFKRLLIPSVENEIRSLLTEKAHEQSINRFADNVEQLLLQNPIKNKIILGWDPGFISGCKLAIIDAQNNVLEIGIAYPFDNKKISETKENLLNLINKYNIDIIAIGNGTASRESEQFISDLIKDNNLDIQYSIVSESGASVYSASKIAQEEFPNLEVQQRSAISIARRMIDPLSELIKIPTESIGVGQYQHDINKKDLSTKLEFVVDKVVNNVGVNVNTVSKYLLQHISGLNAKIAKSIIDYKIENSKINSRNELLKIPGINEQVFEQCSGFLRVLGTEPLDQTNIHPENYDLAYKLLNKFNLTTNDLNSKKLKDTLSNVDIEQLSIELNCDQIIIKQIIEFLSGSMLDYRDTYPQPILKKEILHIEDLKPGLILQGKVVNIIDFGAFIDIGIKETALLHISHMNRDNIPVNLKINEIVDVSIISVDIPHKKIQIGLV